MRFKLDFAPSVATSLPEPLVEKERLRIASTYQTVATPYLREVKTVAVSTCRRVWVESLELTFVTIKHGGDT
jgi:hypothetical protein